MFDISFTEILIISVVALIVIGPEKLPHVARVVGRIFGRARRFVSNVKEEVSNEIRLDELKELRASMQETAQSFETSVRREVDQIKSTTNSVAQSINKDTAAATTYPRSVDQSASVEQNSVQSPEAKPDTSVMENK